MITAILTLALLGCVVYMVIAYVPMPAPMKTLIYIILVIFVIYYLMSIFGIADIPLPRVRR
jgi:predicted membrane channel-forming protein YqfA (hemolysin III family)